LHSSRTDSSTNFNALLSFVNDGKIGLTRCRPGPTRRLHGEIDMRKFAIPVLIAAASLASCTTDRERPLPEQPAAPASIEGTWTDPNGLLSTFQAGNFNTRTTDTNQLLASGTYVKAPGNNLYEISMVSHVQNKQSKVNCAMISPQQLNCTADSGAQFSLTRKSAAVATQ
jgi:hypothetical protein